MFKRLFLVSFDCRYSLVCEVCSVNVLSLLPCHDMYVNVFTTYIYRAHHAVLVLAYIMGSRDDEFRVKHVAVQFKLRWSFVPFQTHLIPILTHPLPIQ